MSCPMRALIKHVLAATQPQENLTVKGWVRTRRDSKGFSFLELNDGSCLANLQVVVDGGTPGAERLLHFTTGASAVIEGALVSSPAAGQKWELRANRVELVGTADPDYPLQKRDTHPNSSGQSPTCARARTCLAPCFAHAAGSPSPFTSFSRSAILFMSILRSSQQVIAREPVRCSA